MNSGEDVRGSRAGAWLTLFILLALCIVSYLDRHIFSLLIDPIRRDIQVSDFQISLVQGAAFALFFAVCGLPMGIVADRYSRRWAIYLGMTVWSLAAAGCGLAHNYAGLFAARLLVGAGEAALMPAGYSLIGDLFPRRSLGRATAIFGMGTILGTGAGIALGGLLLTVAPAAVPVLGAVQPWQFAFLATGLPGLILAFLIFLAPRVERRAAAPSGPAPIGFTRFVRSRSRYLTFSILGFGCMSLLSMSALSWFPTYMLRQFGMTAASVGAITGGLSAGAGLVGFLLSGWLVDLWFGRGVRDAQFRCGTFAVMVMGTVGAVAFAIPNAAVAYVGFTVIMLFSTMSGVAAISHLQIVTPSRLRGRMSALFTLFFVLCGVGGGSSVVAFFTDFILHDPAKVGASLALTFGVFGLLAALLLFAGWRPAVAAVARIEADPTGG